MACNQKTKKTLLLAFVLIFITSLIIQVVNPNNFQIRQVQVQPGDVLSKKVELGRENADLDYRIGINMFFSEVHPENITVRFLNESEYQLVQDNTITLEESVSIINVSATFSPEFPFYQVQKDYKMRIHGKQTFYLILNNTDWNSDGKRTIKGEYYVAFTTSLYDWGLILMGASFVLLFLGKMISYEEEEKVKKITSTGILVSAELFVIRALSLAYYLRFQLNLGPLAEFVNYGFFADFEWWYLGWMEPLAESGLLNIYSGTLTAHQYTPLFITTLFAFYNLPILPIWKVGIPIFLFHIGTGLILNKICHELEIKNENTKKIMLIYWFNPFSLLYGAFSILNVTPYIFFVVVSIYFIIRRKPDVNIGRISISKYDASCILMGIGTLYKQFAAIFLPMVILAIYLKDMYEKTKLRGGTTITFSEHIKTLALNGFRYGMVSIGVFLLGMAPFLIHDLSGTVEQVLTGGARFDIEFFLVVFSNYPVNFDSLFVALGFPEMFTRPLGYLLLSWIPFLTAVGLTYWSFIRSANKIFKLENNESRSTTYIMYNLLFWSIILTINIHLFYPRGSFKYYLLLIIPFTSLMMNQASLFSNKSWISSDGGIERTIKPNDIVKWMIWLLILVIFWRYGYFVLLLIWEIVLVLKKSGYEKDILNK